MRSESRDMKFLLVTAAAAIAAAAVVSVRGLLVSYRVGIPYPDTVKIPLYYDPIKKDYFVQAQIGTKKGWMLVDTGASVSLINKAFVEGEIAETLHKREKITFSFHKKSIDSEKVRIRMIRIANWEIRNPVVNVADLPYVFTKRGEPVFGYLGYDLIRRWSFVRISKDCLTLSMNPPTLHAQTKSFPLRIQEGLPFIALSTVGRDTFCLIDTGSDTHFVSVKNEFAPTILNLQKVALAPTSLQSIEGTSLWLPAIIKQAQEPPFSYTPHMKSIIGNGILQRYEIVLDHRKLRACFLPVVQTNQKGTYGFIPYEYSLRELSGYFIVSPVSNDLVRILRVNGREIVFSEFHRILQPPIGSVAEFTVATKSGEVRQFTIEAFSPEEIGLQLEYKYDDRGILRGFEFRLKSR